MPVVGVGCWRVDANPDGGIATGPRSASRGGSPALTSIGIGPAPARPVAAENCRWLAARGSRWVSPVDSRAACRRIEAQRHTVVRPAQQGDICGWLKTGTTHPRPIGNDITEHRAWYRASVYLVHRIPRRRWRTALRLFTLRCGSSPRSGAVSCLGQSPPVRRFLTRRSPSQAKPMTKGSAIPMPRLASMGRPPCSSPLSA